MSKNKYCAPAVYTWHSSTGTCSVICLPVQDLTCQCFSSSFFLCFVIPGENQNESARKARANKTFVFSEFLLHRFKTQKETVFVYRKKREIFLTLLHFSVTDICFISAFLIWALEQESARRFHALIQFK